jgi:hypothetical protein
MADHGCVSGSHSQTRRHTSHPTSDTGACRSQRVTGKGRLYVAQLDYFQSLQLSIKAFSNALASGCFELLVILHRPS